MMAWVLAYGGLFLAAFISASVLPGQSEVVLSGLLLTGDYQPVGLVAVASIGNVCGAVVNWWLGVRLERFKDRKWFPVSEKQLERVQAWYARHGSWVLLLSWVPLMGDAITVAAGVMRERLVVFILLVGLAKTARYAVLTAVVLKLV